MVDHIVRYISMLFGNLDCPSHTLPGWFNRHYLIPKHWSFCPVLRLLQFIPDNGGKSVNTLSRNWSFGFLHPHQLSQLQSLTTLRIHMLSQLQHILASHSQPLGSHYTNYTQPGQQVLNTSK